ncbi:MAG: hypothetical protein HN842_08260 [Gammaproteobacteria bacterium]|jgi:Fis family transcriptional regulator, factor for inversion stimulation protein|nr:hypothetical protein [Gammaproteobacteria bacterium]MBT7308197.1 hypothetical protein [Gammaproteobacteria bacterium]
MSSTQDKRCNSLRDCVYSNLADFFDQLEQAKTYDLYQRILHEVELPLLELSLERCGGNQSRTAVMLGINRNTLKKKMDHYQIRFPNQKNP